MDIIRIHLEDEQDIAHFDIRFTMREISALRDILLEGSTHDYDTKLSLGEDFYNLPASMDMLSDDERALVAEGGVT